MTPTNTPFEEAISQILIKLHHDGWEKGKKQVETPYTYTLDDEPKREAFKQLTQLHEAAVREAEKSAMLRQRAYDDRIAQLKKKETRE